MSSSSSPYSLYEDLVRHGLIIPTGASGIFGRSEIFEHVLSALDVRLSDIANESRPEVILFPPVMPRRVLETTDYLCSFPQLVGSVFAVGKTGKHDGDLEARLKDAESWSELQSMTALSLTPAACYPLYPTLSGTLPSAGRSVDMHSWVFRNEPSVEPTRMQSFRVREFVRIGKPEVVFEWRGRWIEQALALLQELELDAQITEASDPFFGRGRSLLAAAQISQKLKFEITIPVLSPDLRTAVCSFNSHRDHFARSFKIHCADGQIAHSACIGFGMERLTMAMFSTHGCDVRRWPAKLQSAFHLTAERCSRTK